jgi:hypothetical protein
LLGASIQNNGAVVDGADAEALWRAQPQRVEQMATPTAAAAEADLRARFSTNQIERKDPISYANPSGTWSRS